LVDVLSPCVTFNDHEDSTKSYSYTRQFFHRAVHLDYVPPAEEIKAAYDEGEVMPIELHDGSRILLRKISKDYSMNNRGAALDYIRSHHRKGEIVTGLLYIDESEPDMHEINHTIAAPLCTLDFETLCPGSEALATLQQRFR
ncbi:MAG: 2-oxoacid:ferredoxin oxidoreductase subunit beta, partial [Gammaproteobacteria bacterium]